MKKFLKIIFITLGVLFLLVLLAVAALLIAAHDKTDRTIPAVREADLDTEALIHREAVKALDGAAERDDIDLLLDEYTMNELLYAVAAQVDIPFVETRGAYAAYGEDGELTVELPLRAAGILPTCIKGTLKAAYEDSTLTLTIASASIGKFSCTSGIVRALFLNEGNGKRIEKSMAEAGVRGSLDLPTLTLTMTSEEIAETVTALTADDPNTLLYSLLCDLCLNSPDLLEFSLGENRLWGVTLHASRLAYDPATDGPQAYPLDLNTAAAQTLALGDAVTRKNVSAVFHYYTAGYKTLNETEKAAVDALGLGENGMGVRTVSGLTMAEVLLDQSHSLAASILARAVTLSVTEGQMNTIFAGLDLIGTGTAFCYEGKVAYLALESLNVALDDRALSVSVVFNLGGKRLCGHVATACPDTGRMALDATVEQLRLGSKEMSAERTALFLRYLDGVLASQNWISANAETSVLTLDLGAALEEISEFAVLLRLGANVTMQCRRNMGTGEIQLVFRILS